jgi:hypothetical protein
MREKNSVLKIIMFAQIVIETKPRNTAILSLPKAGKFSFIVAVNGSG